MGVYADAFLPRLKAGVFCAARKIMKLDTIELEGYSSYRDYTQVSIPEGITGIIGIFDNMVGRSNAVGKSSLVMAIIYALYGEGEADKISEFINDNSESMFVRIKFVKDGNDYICERGINKGSSYLDLYQNKNRLGNNIATTQEHINNIMGMDYDMFTASVFFEQMNMDKFIDNEKTSPEERRNYINKVLDIEMWRTVGKDILKDIKKFTDLIFDSQNRIKEWSDKIKTITDFLVRKESVEKDIEELKNRKETVNKYIQEFYTYKSYFDTLNIKTPLLSSEKRDLEGIESKINAANNTIKYLTSELTVINTNDNKFELDNDINKLDDIKKQLAEENLNEKNITNQKNESMISMARILQNIRNLEKQKLIIDSGVCPTCKQDVTKEHLQEENDKISKQIENLDIEMNPYNTLMLELNKKYKDTVVAQEFLMEFVENLGKKIKTEEDKRNQCLLNQSSHKMNLDHCIEQLDIYEKSKLQKIEKINVLAQEIELLEEKVREVKFSENDAKLKSEELTKLDKDINKLSLELGSFLEQEKIKLEISALVKEENEKLDFYREEKIINEELYKIFIEIPKNIFNDSIASIEKFANETVQCAIESLSVKIYEDTSKKNSPIVIGFEKNGKYRSYKRLSGGQKTIVNIGLRLGFSKVISQQTQSNIQFIVMDEPFGALDEENRSLVKKILTLISEYFNQILVITHTEDAESFPNLITVHMNSDECSYIN